MKKALSVIDTLREGWYNPPTSYHKKKEDFISQSYRHSAMNEIKMYLMGCKNGDPISAIEKFRSLMNEFSFKNSMFSIYYDVATDVLDVLLSMN